MAAVENCGDPLSSQGCSMNARLSRHDDALDSALSVFRVSATRGEQTQQGTRAPHPEVGSQLVPRPAAQSNTTNVIASSASSTGVSVLSRTGRSVMLHSAHQVDDSSLLGANVSMHTEPALGRT